jgi:serine/threonine protein kinase
MSYEVLDDLCRRATMRYYEKGEYIIREGDPVTNQSCLYIVKRGTVGFEKTFDEKEGPRELGQIFSGSVFGEGSLLNRDVPRSASCFSASDDGVECALISFDAYDSVVTQAVTDALKEDFAVKDTGTFSNARLSDLEVLRELGAGAYGKVYLVRHSVTGRVCAMKEVSISVADEANYGKYIEQECSLLRSFRHPFIIKVLGTLASQTCVYMALEARLGGELLHAIQSNYEIVSSSKSVRFYIGQVIEVLSYLHRFGIIYRDIKPENLLVGNDGYLTLVDFSVATKCRGETFTLCGTPEYTAPEVYRMTGHSTVSDWWSVGVLMHELSVGVTPFQGDTTLEIMQAIQRYERLYPDSIHLRDQEDDLNKITVASEKMMKSLLCPKAYDRLGRSSHHNSNDLRNHAFFNGFSWKSLRAKTLQPPFIPSVSSKYDGTNFDGDGGENSGSSGGGNGGDGGGGRVERVLGQDRDVDLTRLPKWAKEFVDGT